MTFDLSGAGAVVTGGGRGLASPASADVTGQSLVVRGGYLGA